MLLHQSRYDPRRCVIEVYNDAQPASGVEITPVEVLTARDAIGRTVVWMGNGPKDEIDLVHEVGSAECEMQTCAGVEHDKPAVRICCAGVVLNHPSADYGLRPTALTPGLRVRGKK